MLFPSRKQERHSHWDESLPMTSPLHYQPVERERLEFEPEIYGSDDTTQIFGDDSRLPIGLRELLVDPRLSPSKRVFCCGAAGTLIAFLLVILLFLIGGYIHVQKDISIRAYNARNGLDIVPRAIVDGSPIMFLNDKKNPGRYADEIKDFLDKYDKEQSSRAKFMTDCEPGKKPENNWCRFSTTTSFIRAGQGCTYENKYGYVGAKKEPCILLQFRDHKMWVPKFFQTTKNATQLPFTCHISNTFVSYASAVNITYYPVNLLNANYGGFPLNKIPSRTLNTTDGKEVSDEDGETLYDLPSLAFVKFSLPSYFLHGSVYCKLVDSLPYSRITNMDTFTGVRELRFDIVV